LNDFVARDIRSSHAITMECTAPWDVMLCSSVSTTSSEDCAVCVCVTSDPRRL